VCSSDLFPSHDQKGLGIPTTLTGGAGTGTTNNFVAIKTLIKRLQYARNKLTEFWMQQIDIIRRSMGFRDLPSIEFDIDDFGDENALRRLLIEMADRELISDELLQERFGHLPDLEKSRIKREMKERDKAGRPKASPFHDTQFNESKVKTALQRGYITPEQAGVDIVPGTEKQVSPFSEQINTRIQQGQKGNQDSKKPEDKQAGRKGRPTGSKDSQPRQRRFTPQTRASLELWANDVINKISTSLKPFALQYYNKRALTQLSTAQVQEFENIKFSVLSNVEPYAVVTEDLIQQLLLEYINPSIFDNFQELKASVLQSVERDLTIEEINKLKSMAYANHYIKEE